MHDRELVERLQGVLGSLPDGDQRFARSLLDGFARWRSFTGRQRPHVERLIDKAVAIASGTAPAAPPPRAGLSAIVDLFDAARHKGLKQPRVWLRLQDGTDVRLSVAGERARQPGTINVSDGKGFDDGTWFGRIDRAGAWQPSPRTDEPATLYAALTCLAADPANTAAMHGRRTGACAFCSRELDDARSVAVGYGPVCAAKWGLPWGEETLAKPEPKRRGSKANPVAPPPAKSRVSAMLRRA